MRLSNLRPTPSMAVAMAALVASTAGVAWAQVRDNSVRSGDIRDGNVRHVDLGKNSVRRAEIAPNAVRRSEIARNAVRTSEIARNAVRGKDILEVSLGQVPNATHATRADDATKATNATHATNATNASLLDGWDIVSHGVPSSSFEPIASGTCAEDQVSAAAAPGDLILGTVRDDSAQNGLPSGLTATFLVGDGFVALRLCNATATTIPTFIANWDFLVMRKVP